MKKLFSLIILPLTLLLSSCNQTPPKEINVNVSSIFGYYDSYSDVNKTLTIKEGTKVSELPAPSPIFPEVYTFKGYGLNEINDEVVANDYIIKDNDTLFAKFDRNLKEDAIYFLYEAVAQEDQPTGINTTGFITKMMEEDEQLYSFECSDPDAIEQYKVESAGASTIQIGFQIKSDYIGHLIFKIKGPLNSIEFGQAKQNKGGEGIGNHELYAPGNVNIKAVCLNTITDVLKISQDGGFSFLENLRFVDYVGTNIGDIPKFAFYNCSNLKYVPYMPILQTIGLGAFNGCTNLTNFTLPEKVNKIESNCFANCDGFTNIKLPYITSTIVNDVFSNCSNLKEIDFCNTTLIGARQFAGCSGLETLCFPNNIHFLSPQAFLNCANLKDVTFENGNTPLTLSSSVFSGCNKLNTLKLPRQTAILPNDLLTGSNINVLDLSSIDTFFNYVNLGTDNPIMNKEGKIIVKENLLSLYQNDQFWKTIKEVFVAA